MKVALSGCFDMFHSGHRYLLWKAIEFAGEDGEIIVFINTDESVKRLKGEDRPADTFETRKKKIETFIESTNADIRIVPFSTETELLFGYEVISPDMIMHGDDLTDITKATGYNKYPIVLIPRQTTKDGKELSTTAILKGNR